MVQSIGIHVPEGLTIDLGRDAVPDPAMLSEVLTLSGLNPPLIAKPSCEGSSKGIRSKSIIEKPEDFAPVVSHLWRMYRQPVLVEEFIVGDELTVGVLGNDPPQVLGIMRVLPKQPNDRFVYGLDVKRNYEELVNYECPACLDEADATAVEEASLQAFDILGCRDVARLDFRLRNGIPYFLEVNPLPGLSPKSGDLVYIARFMGMTHAQLIERILTAAIDRCAG